MHSMFKFACPAWVSLFLAGAAMADSIHVSPGGDDGNAGTAAKPVRTIGKAVALVATREGAQEIVIREGVRYADRTNPRDDHSVWEKDTRVRYAMMADERAVAQVPGSCALRGNA
ncbi:MAG: hypothetical protein FJ388_02950 [Verrucomicrobia bacterium]|nr:hypothetical protein [Verrucomicrobiota bacterium]